MKALFLSPLRQRTRQLPPRQAKMAHVPSVRPYPDSDTDSQFEGNDNIPLAQLLGLSETEGSGDTVIPAPTDSGEPTIKNENHDHDRSYGSDPLGGKQASGHSVTEPMDLTDRVIGPIPRKRRRLATSPTRSDQKKGRMIEGTDHNSMEADMAEYRAWLPKPLQKILEYCRLIERK